MNEAEVPAETSEKDRRRSRTIRYHAARECFADALSEELDAIVRTPSADILLSPEQHAELMQVLAGIQALEIGDPLHKCQPEIIL